MYKVREGREEKFQAYLQQAIKLREEGLKNEKIFKFDTICYILTDLLKDGISRSIVLSRSIKSILMKTSPKDTDSFLEELDKILKLGEHIEKFYFVSTSNLDLDTLEQKSFRINKVDVRLLGFNDVESEFSISKRFKKWNVFSGREAREFLRYSYSVLEIKARGPQDGFEKAYKESELFRGVLNFAHYHRVLGYSSYGGIPKVKTLSILQPPKVMMLFNGSKKHIFNRYSIGFFDYSEKRFSKQRNEFLINLIKQINSLKEVPLKERCLFTFRKYNYGLDGNVAGTSFLEFWKILELVSLGDREERGLPAMKVARRIASLYPSDFARDILYALCDKRNFIAHVGSLQEFDQNEINLIRQFCEGAMLFLLDYVNVFEDEATLERFFNNILMNEKDLGRLEKAIAEIHKMREKR